MKKLLLVAVVVAMASAPALAGRTGPVGRGNRAVKTPQARAGKGNAAALQQQRQRQTETQRIHEAAWEHMAWLCGALDLTEEQQAAIEEIRDNARQAAQEAETPEARREILQAAHEEILAVLTAEQLEKLEQLRARVWQGRGGPNGPRGNREYMGWLCGALDLTEEQEAAIEEIRDSAREAAQDAETAEARREIIQAAHEEILALLSPEQLEQLEQLRAKMWQGRGGPGGPRGNREFGAWLCGALDLTEEQQAAIEDIRADAVEAAQDAETPEARREIMQAAHEEILAVLTAEQLEKLEQLRAKVWHGKGGPWGPRGGREYMAWLFGALDLTEEQQAAIEQIREDAIEAAQAAETPEAKRQIMQAAHEEILAVLTAEQLEKLEQLRAQMWQGPRGPSGPGAGAGLEALDLTEAQQAAIEQIRASARQAIQAAETRQARREIMQAAHEEIMAVLTAEQLEKLEQIRSQTRQGRVGPWRPHGRR
jgi:Spy/CpxP family protein refolding chaperone